MINMYISLICPLRNGLACMEERCAWWHVTRCALLSLAMAMENNIALTVIDPEHDRTGLQDVWGSEGGD